MRNTMPVKKTKKVRFNIKPTIWFSSLERRKKLIIQKLARKGKYLAFR